ncbi:MAG: type II secretion system F family protein [Candidatus Omnitrophica bacterium]|nr:type II secretion system F family protein [Candidatus Omnitrophota bacterium]
MAKFSYTIKDKSGKTHRNVVDMANKDVLVEKLHKDGYFIVNITEVVVAPIKKKQSGAVTLVQRRKFSHKSVKLHDLLSFSRQLATMLEAGVPLIRSLTVIETQVDSEDFFKVLERVRHDVEEGSSFSVALAKHPRVFNQFWVSLVEVGESSGTIPAILHKLSFYLQQQAAFSSAIISGIIYPAILFVVACGAIVFFALFVGPKFEEIFTSMNAQLPWITAQLLMIFKFFRNKFFWVLGGSIAAIMLFKNYARTYHGKMAIEKFLFGLPTVGEVFQQIILERFASQMSILIDSGVPILYALDITERLVDNNTCALVVNQIKEAVKQGELLVSPMERSGFFPSMCIQMIMVGEETGELSKMLKHVAAYYQDSVETFMKRFATIIEPFMLVFMGGVIGVIIVAMFLPMFNIAQLGGASPN